MDLDHLAADGIKRSAMGGVYVFCNDCRRVHYGECIDDMEIEWVESLGRNYTANAPAVEKPMTMAEELEAMVLAEEPEMKTNVAWGWTPEPEPESPSLRELIIPWADDHHTNKVFTHTFTPLMKALGGARIGLVSFDEVTARGWRSLVDRNEKTRDIGLSEKTMKKILAGPAPDATEIRKALGLPPFTLGGINW